jgi:hypothetical protein
MILTGLISAGFVMFLTGISMMIAKANMHAGGSKEFETVYNMLFWIPAGLCLGGIISIIPPFILIFHYLLSEKTWMKLIRKNKILGNFVSEIIDEVKNKDTRTD